MNPSRYIKTMLQKQILDIIFSVLSPEETTVLLFGSQVSEKKSRLSDIDIGLINDTGIEDKNFLSLVERLNYEVDTLRKIDLVDFSRIDDKFKKIAMKKVELWHTVKY
ncbi:nucleotidyltransferase domain-containing protein [candidate division KSB1 bacterium]|nr:nucleotidyltransferase domain-containing protein [candidate division KSB1 bacterium]